MRDLYQFDLKSIDVHSPDWFLNLEGKKIGPYPLDALFGLAKDGEIGSDQAITSRHIGDQWATLSDVRAAMLAPPRASTPPPERPTNIDALVNPSPVFTKEDAADSLYNALQKSKELQAKKRENERELEDRPFDSSLIQSPKKNGPSKQLMLIAFFGFIFGVSIWAMIQILNKKEPVTANSSTTTESKKALSPPPSYGKPPTTGSFSTGNFLNKGTRANSPSSGSRDSEHTNNGDVGEGIRNDVPPPQAVEDPAEMERAQQERDRERDQMLRDAQQYQDPNATGGGVAQPIPPVMPMNESPILAPGNPDPNAAPYGSGHNPGIQGGQPNNGQPPADATFQQ